MNLKDLALAGALGIVALLLLPACSTVDTWGGGVTVGSEPTVEPAPPTVHDGGPPDHAPAHGYRRKHQHHDIELEYDAGLGVYVVLGHEGMYFHGEYFYSAENGSTWRISAHMEGPWEEAKADTVPEGLHGHEKKNKGKAKGKGKNKNKA